MPHSVENVAKARELGVALPDPDRAGPPVHRQTIRQRVEAEIPRLEFEQFRHPDDWQERERLNTIRALAEEQLAGDRAAVQRDRVGDANPRRHSPGWVEHGNPDYGETLWRRWTPDAQAFEDAFAPILRDLTNRQREVLHLLYGGKLTYRQTAAVLGISPGPVQTHERRALEHLRAAIRKQYLDVGDQTRPVESGSAVALP